MTWPANGTTNWSDAMKTHLELGHDSDGTHTKTAMLTDMEWKLNNVVSASAYTGEQSVTFPNGLVIKSGVITVSAASGTLTFSNAFSATPVVVLQVRDTAGATGLTASLAGVATSNFSWGCSNSSVIDEIHWIAIGY